jgi:hypothetical protein
MDFGRFVRAGYHDWKLVRLTESGKLRSIYKIMELDNVNSQDDIATMSQKLLESKPIQGRFIVHPKDVKEL